LTDLVKELNHVVMQNAKGEKFITLFIARYNQVTRTLNYINAGHNPPIVYSGNATTFLKTGCTGLGMFPELPRIREGLVTLLPSTTLLCYTDGVVEVSDEEGNEFGTESLEKIMLNSAELTMAELNTIVIRGIDRHRRSMPYIDDITLLSCRFF
jgi:phosphoserine phosphatase RsbU/P